MAIFQTYGAYDVPMLPLTKGNSPRLIDEKSINKLLDEKDGDKFNHKGCYIFSWGRRHKILLNGMKPIYVGKTTELSLIQEAFNDRNIKKLIYYMADQTRGSLQLHLVVPDQRQGPTPKKEINEIEEYLIARAAQRNKKLLNIQGTATPDWVIQGVANKGRGRAKKHESAFRVMMGIKHDN